MSEHRRTWITMADLIQIKQLGWTSVRLPIGHWVLDVGGERVAEHGDGGPLARRPAPPYEGERAWIADAALHCGPDEAPSTAAQTCELSLTVNLCLHGAPGGQSGEQACGFADPLWQPSMWDVDASVRCVEHMARRWARRRSGVVDAITVINEPSNTIPLEKLLSFYERAYEAVRRHSADVGIVFPCYQRSWGDFAAAGFNPPPHMANVAFDCHLYHCFGDNWQRETTLDEALSCARTGEEHWPCLPHLPAPAIVSEWSLRLPTWDRAFRWPGDGWARREPSARRTARSGATKCDSSRGAAPAGSLDVEG